MEDLARAQLAAVAEVLEVADRLAVDIWLRGGWALDFYLGQITREHVDVDWFAWQGDLPVLADALTARGWVDPGEEPADQQRDLVRGDVELGFAPLARTADGTVVVGGGPWAGEVWPAGMLDDAVMGQLGDVRCPVISPAAQMEIKRMMPVWVPGRPRRQKDASDIARLLAAMGRDDAR